MRKNDLAECRWEWYTGIFSWWNVFNHCCGLRTHKYFKYIIFHRRQIVTYVACKSDWSEWHTDRLRSRPTRPPWTQEYWAKEPPKPHPAQYLSSWDWPQTSSTLISLRGTWISCWWIHRPTKFIRFQNNSYEINGLLSVNLYYFKNVSGWIILTITYKPTKMYFYLHFGSEILD